MTNPMNELREALASLIAGLDAGTFESRCVADDEEELQAKVDATDDLWTNARIALSRLSAQDEPAGDARELAERLFEGVALRVDRFFKAKGIQGGVRSGDDLFSPLDEHELAASIERYVQTRILDAFMPKECPWCGPDGGVRTDGDSGYSCPACGGSHEAPVPRAKEGDIYDLPGTRDRLISLLASDRWTEPFVRACFDKYDDAQARLSARGDEYHTMDDLYAHRFALTAALVKRLPPEASCKSRKNGDGSTWDGLFVVYIDTPQGQVSYHYKTELWDKMPCREVETPPPYDGHTPESTLDRLMSIEGLSAQAEPAKDARALVSKIVVALSDWQLDVIELGTIDKAEDRLAPMIERSFQARLASVKEQYRQAMQASQAEVDELVARLSASGLGDTCIDCEHDGEQDKWRPCSSCARNSHDNYESRKS